MTDKYLMLEITKIKTFYRELKLITILRDSH